VRALAVAKSWGGTEARKSGRGPVAEMVQKGGVTGTPPLTPNEIGCAGAAVTTATNSRSRCTITDFNVSELKGL
jgi:hypothetical protein